MSGVDRILTGICTVLLVVLVLLGWRYEATLTEFAEFKAQVSVEGKKAMAAQDALRVTHEKTLDEVRGSYEKQIDTVRIVARAQMDKQMRTIRAAADTRLADRLRDAGSDRGRVRADASSQQVDDDAERKRLVDTTLGNCAEDALKLAAWQNWCLGNQCPINE
ncbi:MAG: hypothetical protein LBL72_08320 [Candidatus Accumulibacter sp.]|jgi:hypothetical protein|nr:hypothetical protein [Accumulibacter sp.]